MSQDHLTWPLRTSSAQYTLPMPLPTAIVDEACTPGPLLPSGLLTFNAIRSHSFQGSCPSFPLEIFGHAWPF